MNFTRREINASHKVQSLCWIGDTLIDVAGGLATYSLDGPIAQRSFNFTFPFDAAIISPSRRYAATYQRLGTKGAILDLSGARSVPVVREIDRSFYCAEAYEYPVAFVRDGSGRELLAHCPKQYNRLELEEIESGKNVSTRAGESTDFFHSRLQQSPGGRWLLSAGWIWHPLEWIGLYDLERALRDPSELDEMHDEGAFGAEIASAAFVDDRHLLIAGNEEINESEAGDQDKRWAVEPGYLALVDLETSKRLSHVKLPSPLGEMLVLDDVVIGFYEHPRAYRIQTGELLAEWPDIPTGKQNGSIIRHVGALPPIAKDAKTRRFAVALDQRIVVIVG